MDGNSDLKYALEQAAKSSGTGTSGTADYVKSLYNRIGTQRADGTTVTLADVDKELEAITEEKQKKMELYSFAPTNTPDDGDEE